ncbi:MAG: alanine racemase [Actinomycetales bacterium]|nr:alanine racemase [Candidatus Lutibacillus vidarii]HON74104.1 alanine racemase [Dermatophilaceae bacterium]
MPSRVGPSCARVDLDALAANVATLRLVAGRAQVLTVVKADGYGHGMVQAARAALAGGATWLGVAQLGEALTLRGAGVSAPLLAWLFTPGEDLVAPVRADIDLGVSSLVALGEVAAAARAAGRTARVHLKLDTGLSRNGLPLAQLDEVLRALGPLQAEGAVALVGAFSHLACADQPGHASIAAQHREFAAALAAIEPVAPALEVRHLANSAATLTAPQTHYDLVRVGIAAYGISPASALGRPEDLGLTPVMTLTARLASVKDVPAGTGVSYGHTYITPAPTRLGLVPLGYGDGIPRAASGIGPVAVGGRRHHIVGRVCMDQVVIDLGPQSRAAPGDEVVVFGPPAAGGPSVQDWAECVGTIGYEIVTRIGARVPREYVGVGGQA